MIMQSQENPKELFTALSTFQGSLKSVKKDAENPFFKSSYATLDACWDAIREPLSENGLSIFQTLAFENGVDFLVTTLAHSSGQSTSSKARLMPVKNDPQAMGSCITYMRRFALCAILGLTQSDDDAESAIDRTPHAAPIAIKPRPGVAVGPAVYRVPFGKWKGLSLEDVESKNLGNYVVFLEETAAKENKPLKGQVLEFVTKATAFLGAAEATFEDIQF